MKNYSHVEAPAGDFRLQRVCLLEGVELGFELPMVLQHAPQAVAPDYLSRQGERL